MCFLAAPLRKVLHVLSCRTPAQGVACALLPLTSVPVAYNLRASQQQYATNLSSSQRSHSSYCWAWSIKPNNSSSSSSSQTRMQQHQHQAVLTPAGKTPFLQALWRYLQDCARSTAQLWHPF
jgi:hypothetical protein